VPNPGNVIMYNTKQISRDAPWMTRGTDAISNTNYLQQIRHDFAKVSTYGVDEQCDLPAVVHKGWLVPSELGVTERT